MPTASTLTDLAAMPRALVRDVSAPMTVAASLAEAKRWFSLAIGSLVVAGLLSLAVVIGRLPVLSRIINDPLFFKRCLVVHVDLALVVWFYAFLCGLLALAVPSAAGKTRTAAHAVAASGVLAMLAGALMRGAEPILANYVPVIDHPLFSGGLAAFFAGTLLQCIHVLAAADSGRTSALPVDARVGLQAAAVTVSIAAATWVSARAGLPAGLDPHTHAEFLAWGPGHVLQAANACAMLAVWLWLLEQVTGATVLSRRHAYFVFGAIVLPQAAMPLLTARGTLDTLYHTGATQLMRWAIFPAMLVVAAIGFRHLRQGGKRSHRSEKSRLAFTGLVASAVLALLGVALGACIRSSTTLVPAHYHAALGAVTVAFMTAAYLVCDLMRGARRGEAPLAAATWRAARRQLAWFGVGQTVFALGFALGGAYGLGRKAYAAEQHVRGAGELVGLIVMGLGGLVAASAGVWFLFLVLREMRGWWRRAVTSPLRAAGAGLTP